MCSGRIQIAIYLMNWKEASLAVIQFLLYRINKLLERDMCFIFNLEVCKMADSREVYLLQLLFLSQIIQGSLEVAIGHQVL